MEKASLKKSELMTKHLCLGFLMAAVITYTILYFSPVSSASTLMLVIFNFLFVSLVFPLRGKLGKKMMLLLAGNMVGLLWNTIFSMFAYAAVHFIGEVFNVFYMILNPLLNLVWIVSFWSISLSFLVSSRDSKSGGKT